MFCLKCVNVVFFNLLRSFSARYPCHNHIPKIAKPPSREVEQRKLHFDSFGKTILTNEVVADAIFEHFLFLFVPDFVQVVFTAILVRISVRHGFQDIASAQLARLPPVS